MSDIGLYLARATEYCAETRNLIEDVIVGVQNQENMHEYSKKWLLQEQLKGMGFSSEQLTAFAKGELPPEYEIIPVDVVVKRYYRTYVRVPVGANKNDVTEATMKQILENGDATLTLDSSLDIEKDDVYIECIDWCGAHRE